MLNDNKNIAQKVGSHMQIESLKFFYEVASVRSISKVAKNSLISQSALSQQIQRLEDGLGYKLLIRSNKGVELTEAGFIVEKYAKNVLKSYDNMVEDLNNVSKNNNIIRINSVWTVATYALPCTLFKVKKKYPNHNYNLASNVSDDVEQHLINDVCDIGFIYDKPNEPSLVSHKVGSDKLVAVVSKDFNIKQDLNIKELLNYGLILLDNKTRERRLINSKFNNAGYNLEDFNILFDLDSTESVKSMVAKGYGISFLPYLSVKKEIYTKELKLLNVLDFEAECDIYIIFKHDQYMKKTIKEFIEYIKKIGQDSFC